MKSVKYSIKLLLTLISLYAATVSADPPYPDPVPPFTPLGLSGYTGSPLGSLFTPAGGTRVRPVLVVRGTFTDVSTPAYFTVPFIERQVFGPMPSIATYLGWVSAGRGGITPGPTSFTCLPSVRGVITVDLGRWSDFILVGNDMRGQRMLRALEPCVDFASFDSNHDLLITNDELIVVNHYVTGLSTDNGGQAMQLGAPVTVDGVTFPASASTVAWPDPSNLLTGAHELMHALYEAPDLYGFGVGRFDVMGPTVGGTQWQAPGAWTRMQLGWLDPQVATRDQWVYFQPSLANGQASLLYHPSRGKWDYFMIEYRRPAVGVFDQNATEEGLVIWRADSLAWPLASSTIRPIELMRSDGVTRRLAPLAATEEVLETLGLPVADLLMAPAPWIGLGATGGLPMWRCAPSVVCRPKGVSVRCEPGSTPPDQAFLSTHSVAIGDCQC